jgi:hypothetical protein
MTLHAVAYKQVGEVSAKISGGFIVVEDDFGNPLIVAIQDASGGSVITHCKEPNFNQILKGLGIDKTVLVEDIKTDKPKGELVLPGMF